MSSVPWEPSFDLLIIYKGATQFPSVYWAPRCVFGYSFSFDFIVTRSLSILTGQEFTSQIPMC